MWKCLLLQLDSKVNGIMEYKSVVLKFGGSVIPDEAAFGRVADVIRNISLKYNVMAVVVSAMGKTTNELDTLAHRIAPDPDKRELDALLATGEMKSAALLAMCLNAIKVDARSYNAQQLGIYGDGGFGHGRIKSINIPKIPYKFHPNEIPVVAGFQAVTKFGEFITLGREGSDITAVALAGKLKADFVWFFKNGGGIYDKNPKQCTDAQIMNQITYDQMLGLLRSNNRNQVLHKRSVELGQEYNMPLLVTDINLQRATWIVNQLDINVH